MNNNNCTSCAAKDLIDKAHPNCAVVGVFGHPNAAVMTYYGLHALQHRGQEAAGITTIYFDEKKKKHRFAYTRDEGLVLDVFSDPKTLTDVLKGPAAVGHNRYSTTGSSNKANIQPFNMIYHSGIISLAHNGNFTNTVSLRKKLQDDGAIFQTTTDTEILMHLVARNKKSDKLEQIMDALREVKGAYSIVMQTEEMMVGACDPYGVRPLNIGRIKNDDGTYSYMLASETAAFDIVSAEYIRPVMNNEVVVIDENTRKTGEIKSFKILEKTPESRHCIFEYIYFSRPDSKIFGHTVDKVRRKLGKKLAEESPINDEDGKIRVVPVPDSANTAALGYAKVNNEISTPTAFELGLIRSHYVGRTFIAPGQKSREFKVKVKFNTVKGVINNSTIVLIDDSIVRGTTAKSLIKLIREAEPKSVHFRVSSPPIKYPCYYGMDFPSKEELIANYHNNEEEIGKSLGVDSLHYLTEEQLMNSVPQEDGVGYCTACFTGKYPIDIEINSGKLSTEE
jgi:amidophosphoribosyltransferase